MVVSKGLVSQIFRCRSQQIFRNVPKPKISIWITYMHEILDTFRTNEYVKMRVFRIEYNNWMVFPKNIDKQCFLIFWKENTIQSCHLFNVFHQKHMHKWWIIFSINFLNENNFDLIPRLGKSDLKIYAI